MSGLRIVRAFFNGFAKSHATENILKISHFSNLWIGMEIHAREDHHLLLQPAPVSSSPAPTS